jgi:hypothetical protein
MKEAIKKRLGATRRFSGRMAWSGSITTFAAVLAPDRKVVSGDGGDRQRPAHEAGSLTVF